MISYVRRYASIASAIIDQSIKAVIGGVCFRGELVKKPRKPTSSYRLEGLYFHFSAACGFREKSFDENLFRLSLSKKRNFTWDRVLPL